MPQANYEPKIENVVKESANVDLNKLNNCIITEYAKYIRYYISTT